MQKIREPDMAPTIHINVYETPSRHQKLRRMDNSYKIDNFSKSYNF